MRERGRPGLSKDDELTLGLPTYATQLAEPEEVTINTTLRYTFRFRYIWITRINEWLIVC